MDAFMSKLKKCCEIIYSTLNLDVAMCDADYQEIPLFGRAVVPQSLSIYWPDYYEIAAKSLNSDAPVSCSWHEIPDCHLLLLDVRLTDPEGTPVYLCIGPALTKMYSDSFYQTLPNWQNLPLSEKPAIVELFKKLPFYNTRVKNAFWISYLMLQQINQLDTFFLTCPTNRQELFPAESGDSQMIEPLITPDQINLNYEQERKWRTFISSGDAPGANCLLQKMASSDFSYRTPSSPIRTQKNVSHSINALCRAAAYDGGAFPVDIHNTHEYYSMQIEKASNMMDIEKISHEIFDSYCKIVLTARTQHYSTPVKKAVIYLHSHYEQPITLPLLAREIHYSEGYLSRIFQKETGQTVSSYLNQLRIQNACKLLETEIYSILDVASLVGFASYSKFSVEFKKHTGMSATEYVKTRNKK